MRHKFLTTIFTLTIGAICMQGCSKKIDEAYLNPNAPIRVPVETILPGVIGGFTFFYSANGTGYGVQQDATLIGRYVQYFGIQTDLDNYGEMGGVTGASDVTGSIWAAVYYGHGKNVNKIIEWGTEEEKWDYVGAAWAIRAWGWLELTNEYNDGILSEAWDERLTQFHYDQPADFYDSCRAVCYRSLSFLSRTDGKSNKENFAQGDAYFLGGDVTKWKKFVYGLLARSYINLSAKNMFAANNYAFADSAAKYADLAMTTNDDNAYVKVSGGLQSQTLNYFGPFRANLGAYRQCAYIADLMSGRNTTAFNGVSDPRAWYMLRENNSGTFQGFLPWRGSNTPGLNSSQYPLNFWGHATYNSTASPTADTSRYIWQNTSPWPMMTASEMQFVKAEALYRKGDKSGALAAYKNAISLDFDMLTTVYPQHIPSANVITQTVKDAYMNNPAVVPVSANDLTLTHIMLQKYIALYVWGIHQTWVDMRKFHYTDLDPVTGKQVYADFTPPSGQYLVATNKGKFVYRCKPRYNSEYLYNVPELTRIGAFDQDYVTKECWFSQK
ncbi:MULTISPECIES: SusD/RagB family nutrient-binding outer membrane lipoprotein [Niastella]|uniref:SusD/RagB family nutrient-binding outer membrane lipoprotein n=1 Tax=Niastella soli TaxID=2821487 RepID=A0ABS3YZC4_9BACT|nr:SusD/RagB family nutrient-binding outer membrane lipoprotein [Niastella soli]MBO9203184.1 SusD/RagB family nutrient-binding outer membrane lipoprotein [Niastella soli]